MSQEDVVVSAAFDVPGFRDTPAPLAARIEELEGRLSQQEAVIEEQRRALAEQKEALATERSKREALEEATAPLLERSQEPKSGEKGGEGATRS